MTTGSNSGCTWRQRKGPLCREIIIMFHVDINHVYLLHRTVKRTSEEDVSPSKISSPSFISSSSEQMLNTFTSISVTAGQATVSHNISKWHLVESNRTLAKKCFVKQKELSSGLYIYETDVPFSPTNGSDQVKTSMKFGSQ